MFCLFLIIYKYTTGGLQSYPVVKGPAESFRGACIPLTSYEILLINDNQSMNGEQSLYIPNIKYSAHYVMLIDSISITQILAMEKTSLRKLVN
jgi:hypothetical protein